MKIKQLIEKLSVYEDKEINILNRFNKENWSNKDPKYAINLYTYKNSKKDWSIKGSAGFNTETDARKAYNELKRIINSEKYFITLESAIFTDNAYADNWSVLDTTQEFIVTEKFISTSDALDNWEKQQDEKHDAEIEKIRAEIIEKIKTADEITLMKVKDIL